MVTENRWWAAALVVVLLIVPASMGFSECLECKSCTQLITLAKQHQQDLRTINAALGSALAGGNLDMAKSYKLTRASVTREAQLVMNAIEIKGCLGGK